MQHHTTDDNKMKDWYAIFSHYAKAPLSSYNADPMNSLAVTDCQIIADNAVFTIGKIGWCANRWRGLKIEAFSKSNNTIDKIYASWIQYAKTIILDPICSANNNAHLMIGRLPQYFLHIAVVKTSEDRVHIRIYALAYHNENIMHISRILHNSYCWSNTKYPLWYYHNICYTPDVIPKLIWQYRLYKPIAHSRL